MPGRRVELLTLEGCPNAQAAHALVHRVVAGLELEADVASIQVEDAEAAERLRFLGSPTVRVDGRDVEPGAETRSDYTLACRLYSTPAGLANVPAEEWVRDALLRGSG
ncbi:MAG: thioredoxin family protein [Actinomycetota bacterium]|nr:thioredoxin family protein [Actinomycetota bacterium]